MNGTAQKRSLPPVLADFRKYRKYPELCLMLLPVVVYFIIFKYVPMVGIVIAFKDYKIGVGIGASEWIGFKNFVDVFGTPTFTRSVANTLIISLLKLAVGFPAPILLALMLNEVRHSGFKRVVQTISYLPYFISTVVICGIVIDFLGYDGAFTNILTNMGLIERQDLLASKAAFRPIFVLSGTWQGVGYGSIIYLAALSGVDQELYEAAKIDGAGRWRQTIHITLPSIAPTVIIMFILIMGSLLNVSMEKIILLYRPVTYDTADVISSFVYRRGLQEGDYGYATAVSIFNSIVNMILMFTTNAISAKYSETSLF